MSETLHANYQSISDMESGVSGTKFFVYVASETKNAHMEWVSKMKRVGHTEVNIQEDADYYLVFCPVKSRIKTDIDEALERLPDNKPVILVVMHDTFDPDLVIVESRLQELPRNVRLTVDSLFYQDRLLRCNRNDIAWNQILKSLNIPIPEPSWWKRLFNSVLLYLSGTKFFVYVTSEPKNMLMGWVSKMSSWCKRLFNLFGKMIFDYVASETRNMLMGVVSKMVCKCPPWCKRLFNYLVNHKELMAGIAVVIVLVILVTVIVNSTAG